MSERTPEIGVDEYAAARTDTRLIDVRSPDEYAEGHVPGAVNVPLEDVLAAPQQFANQDLHVICRSGGRSATAADAVNAVGARAVSVAGGTAGWIDAGHEVERGSQ